MGHVLNAVVQCAGLRLAPHKLRLWSLRRPAAIKIVGTTLQAQEDRTVLGMGVVGGGSPECEKHISKA